RDIIAGRDDRLLAVVGPCSIHDPAAALDYARRLGALAARLADKLFVVMRVYFEKPRTTIGWKGLINDPHLNGTHDMQTGLRLARKLLLDLARLGVPAGTELLDPITPQYLADLISWPAIAARTTETQTHRLPARVLVDCSHAQTAKDFTRQPRVLADLMGQIRAGNRSILGFMLESNLEAGNQKHAGGRAGLRYGVSITDACIDWPTTEESLAEAAAALP